MQAAQRYEIIEHNILAFLVGQTIIVYCLFVTEVFKETTEIQTPHGTEL